MNMMHSKRNTSLNGFSLLTSVLLLSVGSAHAAETKRVTLGQAGVQGNGPSKVMAISADGRFVAFRSEANNLVPGDTNGFEDAFVRDRQTNLTTRVSVGAAGTQGDGNSYPTAISADGRYVAFHSAASNLVNGDHNGYPDAFVRDRVAGVTSRVSLGKNGVEGNQISIPNAISADGRYVVFESMANNLVANDTNGGTDAFVRDRVAGVTTRVSVGPAGVEGNSESFPTAISADGRFVVFSSFATNLVTGDTNNVFDVFIRDRVNGVTSRVNLGPAGVQGNANSRPTSISADGRYVLFWSLASNLVAGDTNLQQDAFVRDRVNNTTTRVSVGPNGIQGDGVSMPTAISADGRYVAFESKANNLVKSDMNIITKDAFVRDRVANVTTLVGVNSAGLQGNEESVPVAISADGRYIGFNSYATDIVTGDTNFTWDGFIHDSQLNATKKAELKVSVTSKPASVQKGKTANYTLSIKNNGPDTAANLILTDIVFNGTVTVAAPGQGSCSKAAISVCRLSSLGSGKSVTVKISIKADAHPIQQQISVSSAPKDNVTGNNAVKISTTVTP